VVVVVVKWGKRIKVGPLTFLVGAGDVGQVVEMDQIVAAQRRQFSVTVTQQGLPPVETGKINQLVVTFTKIPRPGKKTFQRGKIFFLSFSWSTISIKSNFDLFKKPS
jgi:hypothetical protein